MTLFVRDRKACLEALKEVINNFKALEELYKKSSGEDDFLKKASKLFESGGNIDEC